MEASNDVMAAIPLETADEAEPVLIYRDRTSAAALARRLAAVKREILFWKASAVLFLLGLNVTVAMILQELHYLR